MARVDHSAEPKAVQTAEVIAQVRRVPREVAPDLGELRMDTGWLGTAAFERRVGAYLAGAEDPAFEAYGAAQARIVGCVRDIVARAAGAAVAIVSHGRILSVLFGALCGGRLTAEDWRSIRLPDLAVVDLEAGRVERGFFAGRRIDARVLLG